MWQIAYLKILVIWALGYTPSELDDTRNLTYNEQLTCFFSLCEQHYGLNLMFTLYRQYTYNYYLALQRLQRYNQNFFDQTHAPSTCRQNAIMGNNALDPSAIPSTSSGLGATPSTSSAPGAASSSTAALYTPVASISGSKMSRKRKHANEKPFECTHEGCDKKFSKRHHLNEHINTHGNKKPHKCPHCSRGFNSPSGLFGHKKSQHKDDQKQEK